MGIPLVALQSQPLDVAGSLGKGMQLRQLADANKLAPLQQQQAQQQVQLGQQTMQANAMKLQQEQKAIKDQETITQLFAEAGDDLGPAVKKAMGINPTLAAQYQKSILDAEDAGIKKKSSILDYHAKQAGRMAQLAGSVTDESTFRSAIGQALAEGAIDAESAVKMLTQPFDPKMIDGIRQQALTAEQQIKEKADQLKAAEEKRELDAKMPGLVAESKMKEQEAALTPQQRENLRLTAVGEQTQNPAAVNAWVSKINNGEATISQVPYGMRNAVIEAQEKTGETILTNVQRADVKKLTSMQKLVDDMRKLKEKVHPPETGLEAKLSGAYRTAKRWVATDPVVTEVESLLAQIATIARGVSGEVGVLTNPDIARADTLRPTLFNSSADWDAKINSFQSGIDRGYDTFADTAGVPSSAIRGRSTGAPPTASAKTLSMAQLQQAAKDNGVSVEEAKKQAESQGYKVQ